MVVRDDMLSCCVDAIDVNTHGTYMEVHYERAVMKMITFHMVYLRKQIYIYILYDTHCDS